MSKRTYPTIECQSCGQPAKAPNKLTRWCSACRLGKGAEWHDGRVSRCNCGRDYIAWNGPRTQRQCGECFIAQAPEGQRESVRGTCNVCKTEAVLHSPDIRICFPCLDRPEKYDALRSYIIGKLKVLQSKGKATTLPTDGTNAAGEQETP
jgi:hypothetical protein